ncbi:MAG: helix-turn-helix domain-containing protein [Tannerella sp.]|jgi:AraC-like DNA-binding protein|nr:helix-turn-helix domain-containing protein [Tannerella sp.]
MDDIFAIKNKGVCTKLQIEGTTSFEFYGLNEGQICSNERLPLNFIIFVLEGTIEYVSEVFPVKEISAGMMVFVPKDSKAGLKAMEESKLGVMYFGVLLSPCDRQRILDKLPELEEREDELPVIEIPQFILLFLDNLRELKSLEVDCEHFNELKHEEFFILLRRFCSHDDYLKLLWPLIRRSNDFRNKVIEKYYQFADVEGGGVPEFASLVGMGRKNFDRHFRDEFGISPARWLHAEKAKRLRNFLNTPGVTIIDAMDKFHFNSPSHFNHFCRKYFGSTPGAMIREGDRF